MPKGILHIYHIDSPYPSIAFTKASTGEVWLNHRLAKGLPKEHIVFILLHEEGHIVLDTRNELEADNYAFKKYADAGYSLTQSVYALSKILNGTNPEHYWRCYYQLQRAISYDYYNNGNKNLKL